MYRTQPAVSVEAAFLVVVDVSDDDDDVDDPAVPEPELDPVEPLSDPFPELLPELLPDEPESPLSDMIAEDDAPRLSVL
jgi:hypothetical protein